MTDDVTPTTVPASARLEGDALRRRAVHSIWVSLLGAVSGVRRLAVFVLLVASWCALWGSVTIANVLSGVVVSILAIAIGFGGRSRGGVRIVPLLRFGLLVSIDMVTSTVSVIREVLTPTDHTQQGIIAVELPPGARDHLLLLFVAITVTPGTAVVAAEEDGSVVYLHVLYANDRDELERHVYELAELAVAALPVVETDRPNAEPVVGPDGSIS